MLFGLWDIIFIFFIARLKTNIIPDSLTIYTRLSKHNAGATPSTWPGIPWKMIYSEAFESKREAILREREIKARKSRVYIENLIQGSSVG